MLGCLLLPSAPSGEGAPTLDSCAPPPGHILGFHHPDQKSRLNLFTSAAMDEGTCSFPLNHVQLQPLPPDADSIMFASTKHRDRVCLTSDDLQA